MSVALQCFEIAALSENRKELKALLERPGIKFLFNVTEQEIDDLFIDPANRKGDHLKNKDYEKHMETLYKWIGRPWKWSEDVADVKVNVDNEEAYRGLLAKHGNILVESKWYKAEDIFQQVERFLGGGNESPVLVKNDARDARFIAWELFRITGMASELGGQLYKQKCVDEVEREIVSHDLGGMTSCDRVKVYLPNVFRNVYKNLKPEIRNFGPGGSLGKYPDRLTVAYFKQWTAPTSEESKVKRTFQEMRWGYREGEETDLLTGEKLTLPAEKAYRLGELPWDKLHPKAFNAAALGPYIAGREGIGLFTYIKRTDWDIKQLKDDGFAKSLANWLGIAMNEQTVFDGKLRGIYTGDEDRDKSEALKDKVKSKIREYKKTFVKAWWDGLRSLPQWREWRSQSDKLDSVNNPNMMYPLKRIKYMLGRVEILTPDEAKNLPEEFYYELKGDAHQGF